MFHPLPLLTWLVHILCYVKIRIESHALVCLSRRAAVEAAVSKQLSFQMLLTVSSVLCNICAWFTLLHTQIAKPIIHCIKSLVHACLRIWPPTSTPVMINEATATVCAWCLWPDPILQREKGWEFSMVVPHQRMIPIMMQDSFILRPCGRRKTGLVSSVYAWISIPRKMEFL